MKIDGKVHCLFEQSGTFKNEFKKLGIPAEDYDIQNNFGETDHVIDLFNEIKVAYRQQATGNRQQATGNYIRFNQSRSRPCCCFFPLHIFRDNTTALFLPGKKRIAEKTKNLADRLCH